jgi:SprT protein
VSDTRIAALEQRLIEATKACLTQARPWLYGLGRTTPKVEIDCSLRGLAAGKVSWRRGALPRIQYNLALAERHNEDFVRETVPHEVAHVLCHLLHPKARPHGPEWRDIMTRLGVAEPRRCHSFDTKDAQTKHQQRWRYSCGCREHLLSSTRHYRILRQGTSYHCRSCGGALNRAG